MSFAAILFDLDGTLIDSTQLILGAYRHTMERHLGRAPPDHLWLAGLGKPLDIQLGEFARTGAEHRAMRLTYREHYIAHHDRMLAPFPGVREALAELARRNLALAVVTSKMRDTTVRALAVCGLAERFTVVVTVDDVRAAKPDPEPVRVALERLGAARGAAVAPEAAIFVGDSPFDMASGRAAGVQLAAASWGPFSREALAAFAPEWWLERPADIARLAG